MSPVRALSLLVYASLAALGEALVARPALLWLRGQGLFGAVLPWEVPAGGAALLLALLLAGLTLWLAATAAQGARAQVVLHALLLLLVALCLGQRALGSPPQAPADPAPQLLTALRTAAEVLDHDFAESYAPDESTLAAALAGLSAPGFVRRLRRLPLHPRVLPGRAGPEDEPLAGDEPGTIYVAISADRRAAWLTALTLEDGHPALLRLGNGRPARIEARQGTHSLPGRDPAVPVYPGMRSTVGR